MKSKKELHKWLLTTYCAFQLSRLHPSWITDYGLKSNFKFSILSLKSVRSIELKTSVNQVLGIRSNYHIFYVIA